MDHLLGNVERRAVRLFVGRVLREVPGQLIEAALFGSAARGEARPNSDLDILLVFAHLPPDREPQAGMAETIAREVAARSGVPITVWSVAMCDLERGNRTPMLVDALEDAVPIWCWRAPLEPVGLTIDDALRCSSTLLDRVREGNSVFGRALQAADIGGAARRMRDDFVRMCTAALLLEGITRPRRAAAVRLAAEILFVVEPPPRHVEASLKWAERSFGRSGRADVLRVGPPAHGFAAAAAALLFLEEEVAAKIARTARRSWNEHGYRA